MNPNYIMAQQLIGIHCYSSLQTLETDLIDSQLKTNLLEGILKKMLELKIPEFEKTPAFKSLEVNIRELKIVLEKSIYDYWKRGGSIETLALKVFANDKAKRDEFSANATRTCESIVNHVRASYFCKK